MLYKHYNQYTLLMLLKNRHEYTQPYCTHHTYPIKLLNSIFPFQLNAVAIHNFVSNNSKCKPKSRSRNKSVSLFRTYICHPESPQYVAANDCDLPMCIQRIPATNKVRKHLKCRPIKLLAIDSPASVGKPLIKRMSVPVRNSKNALELYKSMNKSVNEKAYTYDATECTNTSVCIRDEATSYDEFNSEEYSPMFPIIKITLSKKSGKKI
jgi:hypothetical protein